MNATPRTDKLENDFGEMPGLCRQLERELAEKNETADVFMRQVKKLQTRLEVIEKSAAAMREALSVIPPVRLRALAEYLDIQDRVVGRTGKDVQNDLRRTADLSETALANDQ